MSTHRIKIPLSDVKYIQTKIEKLLNLSRESHKQGKDQSQERKHYMNSTKRSVSVYDSRPQYNTISAEQLRVVNETRTVKKPKGRKKKGKRDKNEEISNKEVINSKVKNRIKWGMTDQKSNEKSHFLSQEPKDRGKVSLQSKDEPPPLEIINNQSNLSAKSLLRRWTVFQQNNRKDSICAPQVESKHQISRNFTEHYHPNIQRNQAPHSEQIEKSRPVISAQNVIKQESPKQVPYYLNPKNGIPLRTGDGYLSRKYAYKGDDDNEGRQGVLRKKYDVLDKRLNKLKNEVHLQKMDGKMTEEEWARKERRMTDAKHLSMYYKYSPLKKLLNYSTKDKQRQRSDQIYSTAPPQGRISSTSRQKSFQF